MITGDDLQGHWQRNWLQAPGRFDDTTRVHWLQAGAVYADIRIPAQRPDPGAARALADLPPASLRALQQAEGFAGTIDVTDGICTWTRHINWRGFPCDADAGRMSWDDDGHLIEDGVHADYAEQWLPRASTGMRADRYAIGTRAGYLLSDDSVFLLAVGTPAAPASDDPMRAFDSFYTLGRWSGAEGIATLSTNPFCEGRVALRRAGAKLIWHEIAFDGTTRAHPLTGASRP